jgi:hypothetical protein
MKIFPLKFNYHLCSLLLSSVTLGAQTNPELLVGGGVSLNNYSLRNNYLRINQYHGYNTTYSLLILYNYTPNNSLQTGVKITGYKGPIINSKSIFHEYLSVPVQLSIIDRNTLRGSRVQLLVGPQLSMLTRSAENLSSDEFYTPENSFGVIKHFGMSCDLQVQYPTRKCVHVIGLNVNLEYTPWKALSAINVGDYSSIGIRYNYFRRVKHN